MHTTTHTTIEVEGDWPGAGTVVESRPGEYARADRITLRVSNGQVFEASIMGTTCRKNGEPKASGSTRVRLSSFSHPDLYAEAAETISEVLDDQARRFVWESIDDGVLPDTKPKPFVIPLADCPICDGTGRLPSQYESKPCPFHAEPATS